MFPKDTRQARIGAHARRITHYQHDSDYWEYREKTGTDVGIDCEIELVENGEYRNHRIEGQIKGSETISRYELSNGDYSFPMPTITIQYGLSSRIPFAFYLVDIVEQ